MLRNLVTLALCGATATTAAAQDTKAPATKSVTKAPVVTAPAVTPPLTKAPATKTAAPQTATDSKAQTQGKAAATQLARPGLTVAAEAAPRARVPVIMREVLDYDAQARRDPFVSLLSSAELRPTVADLTLVGVLLDQRRPIAVMREAGTNTQYRVTTGMMLGRMRVAQIKRRTVIFSIEEFGLNRLDSLVLGDTTKARAK